MPEAITVTEQMVDEFLRAVRRAAQRDGFPVNAYMLEPDVLTGNFNIIRAVVNECVRRKLMVVTTGGEIQSLGDATKPVTRIINPPGQNQ